MTTGRKNFISNGQLHPILNESLEIASMKLGLDRVSEADAVLGFPSRQFLAIHIAGTNGKGSVALKIAKTLEATGKKTALYTSPHLFTYRERICVNSEPISEKDADRLLKKIQNALPDLPTYFELLTLLAFTYFAEKGVEIAVLETGMGGRLDATNIVSPLLSIITSIDYDHTQYLGNSLEEIAQEKGGIIKPQVSVLLGPHAKPIEVFQKIAEKNEAPLFQVFNGFSHYEEENRAIARQALHLLPFEIEEKTIDKAICATPKCRFEIIRTDSPLTILDVGHNPNGLERTFERIRLEYPNIPIRALAAFSQDKEIETCINVLKKHVVKIHLTHTPHFRLQPLGESFDQAFKSAFREAKKNREILLICGTFFIMKEAKEALSKQERVNGA